MRIEKIYNNNVISAYEDSGSEIVVMGRGIAFGKKIGDPVDAELIEKVFRIQNDNVAEQYKQLLENIPFLYVELSNDIIAYAESRYNMKLNQSIYVTLPDHIHFALERLKQGIEVSNAILWEIQKFYNSEFQVGRHAVRLVKERLNVDLTDDEAGFIALHFVNAEYDTNINKVDMLLVQIQDILNIVKQELKIELDESSLHYERFLTHLKFLMQRVYKKELLDSQEPEMKSMTAMMRKLYPTEFLCSEKIVSYINEKTGSTISEEETMYLSIHIKRISSRDEELL